MKLYFSSILWLLFSILFFSCDNQINNSLKSFDTSLDSLIPSKTYNHRSFTFYHPDTLNDNPKKIVSKYYTYANGDSMLIKANCRIVTFRNNNIYTIASEDLYGKKYVKKYVIFDSLINQPQLNNLFKFHQKTDTIIYGQLYRYDIYGNIVKYIHTYESDYRILEVKSFDHRNRQTELYRKEYFNKNYNIEELEQTDLHAYSSTYLKKFERSKTIHRINDSIVSITNPSNHQSIDIKYTYDNRGNWVISRTKDTVNGAIIFREITYE